MIARMLKVFVVVEAAEKDRLLGALRELGVVHLAAVDPAKAKADEKTLSAIGRLSRAEQVLATVEPAGEKPPGDMLALADRAHDLYAQAIEDRNRLSALAHEAERLTIWGDVRLEQFEQLRQEGWEVRFVSASHRDAQRIAACSTLVAGPPGRKALVAVVLPAGQEIELPASAEWVPLPDRDRPTVLAEAKEIDLRLKESAAELSRLATARDAMRLRREELIRDAAWTIADRGGAGNDDLYAVQGWVPQQRMNILREGLDRRGLAAAIEAAPPADDDAPPTLIHYPAWARPMQGLFDMLGVAPGYREFEVSWAFMLALPFFSAMLIGDAIYGLLLVLAGTVFGAKLGRALSPRMVQLLVVVGGLTIVWGVLNGSYLCITPADMQAAGGPVWPAVGSVLAKVQIIGGPDWTTERSFYVLAMLSFIIGTIHMSGAHIWQAVRIWPSLAALSHVGWAVFLWGMLFIVRMFVLNESVPVVGLALLAVGTVLAVVFTSPNRNVFKMLLLGVANFPLTAIGALGDIISYIRLMAIGLAGATLGVQFNMMIGQLAQSTTWFVGVPVLTAAHMLNIALGLIALFAHGVRLNMLEFSNHLGLTWSGYAYRPFSADSAQET